MTPDSTGQDHCAQVLGANLVAFARVDGAQLGSIAICEYKARASVKFRRPTKVFEDGIQKSDFKYPLSLDDIIASRGGIPLIEDGKLIGAIGCSGGAGSQDEAACMVGVATINKYTQTSQITTFVAALRVGRSSPSRQIGPRASQARSPRRRPSHPRPASAHAACPRQSDL